MRRIKKINLKLLLIVFVSSLLLSVISVEPACAAGASLYLTPSTGTKVVGSQFGVSVKVNTDSQAVNAAEGSVSYDTNLLDVLSVSQGGSIFTLWTANPQASGGNINFGGGIPNPGYNGTAGHIFSITFRAKKVGTAQVRFTSGAVLANDGKGTNILSSMGSASFTISPQVEAPKEEPAKPAEPDYNKPVIKSPTHPKEEIWYNNNDPKFIWELPQGVNGVSMGFDEKSYSDPGPVSDGLISEKEYEDIEDGIWYFHLKYKDSVRWGTVANYKVMIDTAPPEAFKIEVKLAEAGDLPELSFKTEDKLSGIKHYEVLIDEVGGDPVIVEAEKASYIPVGLGAGEHSAIVRAVDNAGNTAYAETKFTVLGIDAPVIVNYSNEIKSNDQFFVSGTALPNVTINVFIEAGGKNVVEGTTVSDNNGNWFFVNESNLENGRYIVWAEAINEKGIKSGPSNKVSFLVTPPVFTKIGSFVINYFTVFVSLLFLIVLIIALIFFIIWLARRKLKKETKDVEDILLANAEDMKKTIDKEFEELAKFERKANYKKEKEITKENLKKHVDDNTKKSLKEIRDVEELLK